MTRLASALLLALALFAACADDEQPDVLVVVQETNMPGGMDPCAGFDYSMTMEVTKSCDSMQAWVHVCANTPICSEAFAAIAADVAACENPGPEYSPDNYSCP